MTPAKLDTLAGCAKGEPWGWWLKDLLADSEGFLVRKPERLAIATPPEEWVVTPLYAAIQPDTEQSKSVANLIEAAQWARNRLEAIADESWRGDARDFKRSLIGVFADFDAALAACGSVIPADFRRATTTQPDPPQLALVRVPEIAALLEAAQRVIDGGYISESIPEEKPDYIKLSNALRALAAIGWEPRHG